MHMAPSCGAVRCSLCSACRSVNHPRTICRAVPPIFLAAMQLPYEPPVEKSKGSLSNLLSKKEKASS